MTAFVRTPFDASWQRDGRLARASLIVFGRGELISGGADVVRRLGVIEEQYQSSAGAGTGSVGRRRKR
jgi:hypothetical protein